MYFVNLEKNWPSRLLLLLLLLSAQSFSLAHELTHVPYSEGSLLCEICSAGHGLDTGVVVAYVLPVVQCAHNLRVIKPIDSHHQAETSPYIARAPPSKDAL